MTDSLDYTGDSSRHSPSPEPSTSASSENSNDERRLRSLERQASDLLDRIRDSTLKLEEDCTSRGDLKILSRTLRELRYAFKVFSPYRNQRKVTIFGSARTLPDEATYQQAVEFGRRMSEHKWLTITGAGSGIMEAGHRGAGRENSLGLNIMLPFEQSANPVILGDPKLVHMKYFFTRKLMFVKECNAVCLLPGGFGTLDEGFEVLTLLQTGKHNMIPVVFLDEPGGTYWQDLQDFIQSQLLKRKLISPSDLSLYKITDDVEEAVSEITGFFRNYHSMRYVGNRLALRVQEAPSEEFVEELRTEFADILVDGELSVSEALPVEKDEPELAHLPRVVLRFNRRDLGRLRVLIDCLNRGSVE